MSEIDVRLLGEDDWESYREVRLQALRDAPDAFGATAAEEEDMPESEWRARMLRSDRLVAVQSGATVGVVSLRPGPLARSSDELDALMASEVFGLWVAPEARGAGVPERLIDAAALRARTNTQSHLVYWVGVDNARAVAFASGYGFRPTDSRRSARQAGHEGGTEAAMLFPLAR